MTRIYQQASFAIHDIFLLDAKAAHHLMNVLRARVNDPVIIFNGQGGEYHAVIVNISKKNVEVRIDAFVLNDVESPLDLHLVQGIARGEKMDFIIQKAVELGVKKITPLITERCNVKLKEDRSEKRWQHWQSIIISACEQSGRNVIPALAPPIKFNDWLAAIKSSHCFVLSPHVTSTLSEYEFASHAAISVVIGPEGGLSEAEINAVIAQGGLPLRLGARILRTETASLAVLSALQARYGDFG